MRDKEKYNAYHKKYQLKRYHERRAKAIKKLGGICIKCSSTELLELDHIHYAEKSFNIAKLWSCSEAKFQTELSKCQLLCEKCHQKKSIEERDYNSRSQHGTFASYRYAKCRCDPCKKANSDTQKDYYSRKRGGIG
jgi:5-methylcytosine-specific restriction endonuclease McrA